MVITVKQVIDALNAVAAGVAVIKEVPKNVPFGAIQDQAVIKYQGRSGRLVWDKILVHELTFVDDVTGDEFSLGFSPDGKKMKEIFDQLVERYG